jgi:hypothetical protein
MTMYFAGLTLNLMTMSGLVLGIGMLVDNSIVILENIYRYREKGAKLKTADCRHYSINAYHPLRISSAYNVQGASGNGRRNFLRPGVYCCHITGNIAFYRFISGAGACKPFSSPCYAKAKTAHWKTVKN